MKKNIFLLSIFLLIFATSCEQAIEKDGFNESNLDSHINGNWEVNAYLDNELIFGPFTLSTKEVNNKINITDNGSFWNFNVHAEIISIKDIFRSEASLNASSPVDAKVNILNGAIIDNDKIIFEIEFEDDETSSRYTYYIEGKRSDL